MPTLRSLTVCQPYASLIMLSDRDGLAKRCENRTWYTDYRGRLLIHAGQSKKYLGCEPFDGPMGCYLGTVDLIDCIRYESAAEARYPWLRNHLHYEGPYCWLLADVRPFAEPIRAIGRLGLHDPTRSAALAAALAASGVPEA